MDIHLAACVFLQRRSSALIASSIIGRAIVTVERRACHQFTCSFSDPRSGSPSGIVLFWFFFPPSARSDKRSSATTAGAVRDEGHRAVSVNREIPVTPLEGQPISFPPPPPSKKKKNASSRNCHALNSYATISFFCSSLPNELHLEQVEAR